MTLTPEQLKAIQEKADAMRKAAQPPAAEAAPPAPKPAPRRPPPKPRPEPTQDVSGLERRIAQIDEELGQGPQQTAGGIRLAKIRDAAYEVVRVSKLPAKSPQDIEASNKALQEYVRLETEERDDAADAYQRSFSPEVKLRTQAERVRRDLTPEGQTSIGDLKRIDDKLVPIEDKITKLGQSSGMGDVKKWDEPIFQAREDYESKPVDKSYSPVLMDPSGMPVEQYVPQEEKDARDESQKHLRNLSLRSDPSYFDVPDPELGGLIEAPIDLVEDQSLRENIEKLRNEFYASPFVKEGGTADIYHIRVDPFRLVGSDSDPSPAVLLDRLTDAYTLGEYRVRGYTSDNRPTQKEYDQIRERARDLAQNKLLSVWAEYGNANFRVMKDADKAIDDALAWGPAMAPLMLLGTAGTGLAGFEHDATGRKVLSGIPIYQRGDSLTNSFRISPITAVWAWLDDPNGSVDIGGENGWGSKSQLKREVYGYEPSQSLEHLLLANRIFTGAATITEAEGHSSPLIKLAIQNYGVDDNSNMGREAAAYAGTAFTGLAYLLLDPNVWNVATLGAAKLSKPLGMTRALNTLRLRYATEAETLEQLAIKIATMEGDDAAKAKAILELEAATHQKPGSPQALIVESARSRVRVRNANRVAGAVDPETHLPRASAAANERRYVGDFVPMEPGITPEQQELLGAQGQKFQAAEQSAKLRMAARQAKAARAAKDFELEFGRPPGQAQSAEQVAEARLFARARRALEGNEAGLQAIGEVESAQAARDAAAVKLAPIELTFRGKRQAGSIQQILRALYTNHRAVMRLATGYLSDLAGASEAGRKIATNRYLAEISKLAQNQIANLGDLSVATSIAEFAKLDAALDAKIQTVVHQLGLSPLDGPAVAREFGQLRAAHARSLDAIGRYEDLFKAARALDPTTVAEMYAKEFGDLKDSLRAGVKKIPESGNVELEYPKHVQDGKIDGPAYHQALMEKYGVAYERSMDSPLVEPMKRLSRQKGIALTSFQEDALRDMEQGLAAEAFKRGPYAGVAYGQGLIQTLLDSPRFRGDLTLLWARLLNRWGRRLDLVGGTEMGMRSATAKIVVRHNYERVRATLRDVYAITSGEIQPLGELSGPPLHGVEAALDFLTNPKRPLFYDYMGQPLPWNQGGMTPAEKAYHYIRSVVAVDGAARNLTVKILQGMPLASGQAAREPVVGRALGVITRKFSASPPKDMATFYDEVLDGLESVFYKEKGATDARGVSRHFLVNALSYGSAQYDGWLEIQRLMGTGMDATTANALNYMQVSDASALAIGSPELAAATAGRWGLPTGSATHIGKAELIDLFKPITPLWRSAARTDARLVQSGLDQNFGIWVPRAYVDAVENNEAFSHLAKEMVEFSSNPSTIVGAAAQAWWTMLRLARVLGLYLPRGGLIGSNGLGNWSSLILERGGFQRALMPTATSAMAAAVPRIKWGGEVVVIPRIGPLDGFVLQETLARASQKEGSLLAAAMDNGFYEVLSASDDAILTPPGQPPISKRQLWKEVQEAGLRSNLTTPEMDEIYRLRADSAVADAPPAVGGTPGPIDPAQAVTETPLTDMATATVADGPDPDLVMPEPASGKKVLSFEMKGASRSEQEMEPYIRMYRAKFSPEEAEAKIAALREAHSFKMEQFVGLSMDETGLMRPQDLLRTPDGRMFTVSDVARSLGVELTSTDEPARIFDMDLTERFNPSFFPDGNLQVPDDEMVRIAFSDPANPNRIIWAKTDFGTFRRSMRELGSVPDAGTAPILQWKGGVDPLHEAGTSTQIHLDPAQEAAHRRAIPSTVPQPPAPNYPWVGGAPPPEQPPIPPRPRAPDPQGPRRYYELAKKTLLRFMRKPSVGYIQRFGRWIEDLEANMRIAYYTNLRVREGVSAVEAETRAHSRFMDFSGGIMNIEAPLLGRSIMIYRFHRLVFRQIGENIALSMAEANAHPWWALFGETPIGRKVRLVRAAKTLPDVLDWRDPDEKLDDAEQLWEFQRRALPWWTRAQLMLPWSVDKDWSQAEKDLSGRVATKANLTVSSILAMDELYMLNAGIQAMLALTVAGAEQAGIDTNQQSVAASRISEAMIQEFTDRVDPTFGAVWEAMNDSSGSPKGVLISRDRAVLYRKVMAFTGVDKQLKMGSLDWIEEDVDGQLRVSPNGIVFLDFLVQFFDRDLARYIAAWDTPELRSGETGRALQRSMAAMLGLYSVSGFDPAAQWDYDARDRAASLRDLVKDAERKNEPKDKIER